MDDNLHILREKARNVQETIFLLSLGDRAGRVVLDQLRTPEKNSNPYLKDILANFEGHREGQRAGKPYSLVEITKHFTALQFVLARAVAENGATLGAIYAQNLLTLFLLEIGGNQPGAK